MKRLFMALILLVVLLLAWGLVAVFMGPRADLEHLAADAGAAGCPASPAERVVLSKADAARLGESTALESGAKTEPAFDGEDLVGMRFLWVRPESLYGRVGLCSGDVVTEVAGESMSTPEAVLEVYEKVKGMTEIAVVVRRNGASKRFVVVVR